MIPSLQRVALAAGDDGPRAALAPLLAFGAQWGEARTGLAALVCGTSQSDAGFALEAATRRQAANLGIPVACIEDFPGNYRPVEGAPTRKLIVEGEFSEALYRRRLGSKCPELVVVAPARYDTLRGREANPGSAKPPYRVLWAGQPETSACLATLEAITPFLRSEDVELLFRAHPRDPGHPAAYRALGFPLKNVTAAPIEELYRAPLDLVVTQYSSIAVEAGFLGVPSVHVLLPEAGGGLLLQQKGYSVPMPCEAGASFLVEGRASLHILERALRDAPARRAVISRFRESYHADTPQAPKLLDALAGIIAP